MVKARSQFKERSSATNVEILLPLPPDAITPNVRTSQVWLDIVEIIAMGAAKAHKVVHHSDQASSTLLLACNMLVMACVLLARHW